ncbi:PREDICTED: desiccation-related protein PCC13-62 [Tarenaya hassleriana]|uniref:desiccation-related protein PCC13-62 n=1 Tax=Tarenaya hassleriana TaxID=28532 RepID=UPI00053C1A23|nr:PREDICTED: desiccation-related protein PCC13-62 [Tarenaya hassleriana]
MDDMFKLYLSLGLLLVSHQILGISCNDHEYDEHPSCSGNMSASDAERVRFAMNLEFFEAEFFLEGATGKGLDAFNKTLAKGGPPPVGAMKANLDPITNKIVEEFAYQEIGHLRAIADMVGGIQRPLLNLSKENFATTVDRAVGRKSDPPFDPYANSLNYLIAMYIIPYVGLTGYTGTIPFLVDFHVKRLVGGLLGVESGQDAAIRTLLYERQHERVKEYGGVSVAELTDHLSTLRNELGMCGIKDEGLSVPLWLGAENRTTSNLLSANQYSLSYGRTPQEILRIVYGTGDEHRPGGFFPCGANGEIARGFLEKGPRYGYDGCVVNHH